MPRLFNGSTMHDPSSGRMERRFTILQKS